MKSEFTIQNEEGERIGTITIEGNWDEKRFRVIHKAILTILDPDIISQSFDKTANEEKS